MGEAILCMYIAFHSLWVSGIRKLFFFKHNHRQTGGRGYGMKAMTCFLGGTYIILRTGKKCNEFSHGYRLLASRLCEKSFSMIMGPANLDTFIMFGSESLQKTRQLSLVLSDEKATINMVFWLNSEMRSSTVEWWRVKIAHAQYYEYRTTKQVMHVSCLLIEVVSSPMTTRVCLWYIPLSGRGMLLWMWPGKLLGTPWYTSWDTSSLGGDTCPKVGNAFPTR